MVNVHFYCYVNLINLPITLCAAQQWQINFWLRSLRLFANVKSYEPKCHAPKSEMRPNIRNNSFAHRARGPKTKENGKNQQAQRHSLFHWLSIALWDSIKFNEHRINSSLSLTSTQRHHHAFQYQVHLKWKKFYHSPFLWSWIFALFH